MVESMAGYFGCMTLLPRTCSIWQASGRKIYKSEPGYTQTQLAMTRPEAAEALSSAERQRETSRRFGYAHPWLLRRTRNARETTRINYSNFTCGLHRLRGGQRVALFSQTTGSAYQSGGLNALAPDR